MATFDRHEGFMPAGNDVHSAQMSVGDAKKWCAEHPECLGFCFNGPPGEPPDDAVITAHFKSRQEWSPGEGWHTYIKKVAQPPAPAPAPAPGE